MQSYQQEIVAQEMGALLAKKVEGSLTADEAERLENYLSQSWHYRHAAAELEQQIREGAGLSRPVDGAQAQMALQRIWGRHRQEAARERRRAFWRYAVAAMAVLCLGAGLWWVLQPGQPRADRQLVSAYGGDVLAEQQGVVLVRGNGDTLALRADKGGLIAGFDGLRYADGTSLRGGSTAPGDEIEWVTVRTRHGSTYRLVLPDSSVVWLNALSSLRYPARFTGDERLVELEGEAFFEVVRSRKVAKSPSRDGSVATQQLSASAHQRFKVLTKGQVVEVLGTEFNISAYPEEPSERTTLVSGSVQLFLRGDMAAHFGAGGESIEDTKQGQVLRPGEQSELSLDGLRIRQVDTYAYTAWKSDRFVFEGVEIVEVLRQLARWYDVEIDDQRIDRSSSKLYGEISRKTRLSQVLQILGVVSNAEFEIIGRRVVIR